ncbi:MAG: trigger factor [Deltaproteobacteria bacterium]|nr:trigger factor [Deltaproteobacteria bacterium]
MKTILEDVSSVQKKIKIEVPADVVAQARIKAVHDLQKKVKVEGFRPGKVPSNIIEQRFAHEVQHETVEKVVDLTLAKAFKEAKVYPISRPEITPGLFAGTGGLSYTATFDVLPAIPITEKDYKGLKLEKTEIEVTKEEVESELIRLQKAMTQLEPAPAETVLVKGLVAVIDFKGTAEGKSFKGGEAKDYVIEFGDGEMLGDFEKGIEGAKVGEVRKISFDYPKDYFNKELAGKKAQFDITVKEIRTKNVPKLDDDFAKDLGQYKTLEDVKVDLEKRIVGVKEVHQKGELFNQILKQLVDKIKFEAPQSLITSELRHMLEQFAQEIQKRGQKLDDVKAEEVLKEFQPEAENRVRSFLILDKIVEEASMDATDKELEDRLESMAKQVKRPLAEIKAHYEKNNLLGSLKNRILHEKSLEFVLNEAKIKVVKSKNDKKRPQK